MQKQSAFHEEHIYATYDVKLNILYVSDLSHIYAFNFENNLTTTKYDIHGNVLPVFSTVCSFSEKK